MLLVNGEPSNYIDARDRGLAYGDGLFETMAVRGGTPELWDAHIRRLNAGCERLGIPLPDSRVLRQEVAALAAIQELCVAKIVVTRGAGGRGYRPPSDPNPARVVMITPWPDHPRILWEEGVSVRLCRTRLGLNPDLAGLKHLNRLEQVLARREWENSTVHEGIVSDVEGNVVEGTMSNLFMLRDGILTTPRLERCGVAGVMREKVMAVAKGMGIPVMETRIRPEELTEAEGLFLTNSLIRLWPFRELEGRVCMRSDTVAALARELDRALEA